MAERYFVFVQMELPWALGPPDGRYLLRKAGGPEQDEPQHVLVLSTVGAERRGLLGKRARKRRASPEPAPVPVARATVVDAVALPAERQARAWLAELDPEREAHVAAAALNRLLFAHRIASAAAYVREVSPAQAIVIRAGFGEGEQVAEGLWTDARELLLSQRPARRRAAVLRPQERLAGLLSGRGSPALLCEELALRARADLDQGRTRHAAVELERAYAAALAELPAERSAALAERLDELHALREDVIQAACIALGELTADDAAAARGSGGAHTRGTSGAHAAGAARADTLGPGERRADETGQWHEPGEAGVRQALERLEAALRARTATGVQAHRSGPHRAGH